MKYTEEDLEQIGVIYATVSGKIEAEKLANFGKQTRQRAHDSGQKFLLDLTRASGFPSIIEAHTWFNDYYDEMDLHLKWVPTAHLCLPRDLELLNFIETSWTNRGANVRAFTDREAALAWISEFGTDKSS